MTGSRAISNTVLCSRGEVCTPTIMEYRPSARGSAMLGLAVTRRHRNPNRRTLCNRHRLRRLACETDTFSAAATTAHPILDSAASAASDLHQQSRVVASLGFSSFSSACAFYFSADMASLVSQEGRVPSLRKRECYRLILKAVYAQLVHIVGPPLSF